MEKSQVAILLYELYLKSQVDFESFDKKIKEVLKEPS